MLCLFLQKWLRDPVHGAGRMSEFPDHYGVYISTHFAFFNDVGVKFLQVLRHVNSFVVRVVSFSDRNNGHNSFPSYLFEHVETDHVGVWFVLER